MIKYLSTDTNRFYDRNKDLTFKPVQAISPSNIQGYVRRYSFDIPTEFQQEQEDVEEIEPINTTTPLLTEEDEAVLDKDGTVEQKQRAASHYLQSNLGLTKEQAASLIGVWQAESSFNLNAENKEEKSGKNSSVKSNQYGIGIGQWTGDRHDAYTNFIKSRGGNNSLRNQLDFAINEISTNYKDYLNNLRSSSNVKDATAYTYIQYVGGNQKGITDTYDLYRRVQSLENKYNKKHLEMYGKAGSGSFQRRVNNAMKCIFAKDGGILKRK